MVLTNEDFLVISKLMDVKLEGVLSIIESKLQPIRDDIRLLKLQINSMQVDIDIMKDAIMRHSEKLGQLA